MKRILFLLAVFGIICASCVLVKAGDPAGSPGTVLYHQDFGEITDFDNSGIYPGSLSSDTAEIACRDGLLTIQTTDSRRVYLLLPPVDKTDSYTLEFSFRFTDTPKENGYVAALLTCRGREPTNITELVFRADGTVDDFSDPGEKMRNAISSGAPIDVIIPVEDGVLHQITLAADGESAELERNSVLVISRDEMGFAVRNSSAAFGEIFLVDGTGYSQKTGRYAEASYATDSVREDAAITEPASEETIAEPPTESPATGNALMRNAAVGALLSALAAAALYAGRKRRI